MDKIRAAIFDVDGTLFDYKEQKIHESTISAIQKLKDAGTAIIVASGRSYPLLGPDCLSKIPADYYVTANGHSIQDSRGREIFSERFTYEQTEFVVELTKRYNNGLMLKYENVSYLYNRPDEMFGMFTNFHLNQKDFVNCPDMNHHQFVLPIGFTIRGCDEMKQELAARADDYRVELFFDESECDVFSPKVNKMTALKRLFRNLRLDGTECMAFGDSRNDIEMIQWAGCGVAMGNACDDLKEVADVICAPSWSDGISQTVDELFQCGNQIA